MIMRDILNVYSPITLDEMSGISLMNRTDTKFVTGIERVRELLFMAKNDYFVQQTGGMRILSYYSVYFDTKTFDMYVAHQNGKLNRQKIRIRSYVDSGDNFLEVKTKNNRGQTDKKRIPVDAFDPFKPQYNIIFSGDVYDDKPNCVDFLKEYLYYSPVTLKESLEIRFDRITLVNKKKTERLTIDMNLNFLNTYTGITKSLEKLAVIELKRDGLVYSPVLEMLRTLRILPMGFSKYCIGSAITNLALKRNRILTKLRQIEKISVV